MDKLSSGQSNETTFNEFMRTCGLEKHLSKDNLLNARLLQDLGIYGDEAESILEVLQNDYSVDLSSFDFNAYFPDEFPGRNRIEQLYLWLVPFTKTAYFRKSDYRVLYLHDLKNAIENRRLV